MLTKEISNELRRGRLVEDRTVNQHASPRGMASDQMIREMILDYHWGAIANGEPLPTQGMIGRNVRALGYMASDARIGRNRRDLADLGLIGIPPRNRSPEAITPEVIRAALAPPGPPPAPRRPRPGVLGRFVSEVLACERRILRRTTA